MNEIFNKERTQPIHQRVTRPKRRIIVTVIGVALLISIVFFWVLREPAYSPPPFEANAAAGAPTPPDNLDYSEFEAVDKFKFKIAGTLYQQEDGSVKVYLTNPDENSLYLMCEIIGDVGSGDITLYRSGLLQPGEYVENLEPLLGLENTAIEIKVNIYALDSESFHSMGTVTLDNVLQPN
jgi:acylphosphatase